jgi:hypothetical protein
MKNNCNSNSKRGVLFVNRALLLLLLLLPVVRSSCFCRSTGTATPDNSLNGLKLSPSVFRNKKTETFSPVCPCSWTHNDFQKETCSRFQHPGIFFLIYHPGFNSVFKNEMKKKSKQQSRPKCVHFGETANQGIDDTNLNDASMGTNPHIIGVAAAKYNGNGRVRDSPLPTNNNTLNHLASGVACQERREECPLGKTGTTLCC